MGGGLWRDKRKAAPKVGDITQQADAFRQQLKHDDIANELVADIRRYLEVEDAAHNEDRDTAHLHASEICKSDWCPRSSWYRITGVPADTKAKRGNVLIYREGHDIHDRHQGALWKAGRLSGEFKCLDCGLIWWATSPDSCPSCDCVHLKYWEVPIEDESIRLLGRGDGIVEGTAVGPVLLEVKSIGLGTIRIEVPGVYRDFETKEMSLYELWGAIKRPFPSHVRQIMLYMRALGLKHCIALYQNKWDQGLKAFHVRYLPNTIEPIITQCKTVVEALENGSVVRRPEWAEDEKTKACKECPYRRTCWKLGDDDGDVQDEVVSSGGGARRLFKGDG